MWGLSLYRIEYWWSYIPFPVHPPASNTGICLARDLCSYVYCPLQKNYETLTSAAWILISFLQNRCLWCWGLHFSQRPFHAVPNSLSVHSINNFPNTFFAHNNPSKCPFLRPFSIEKRTESLQRIQKKVWVSSSHCQQRTVSSYRPD